MSDVYILSAVRTPIGKFGGSLSSLTAADMGVVAAKAAIERGHAMRVVDLEAMANTLQAQCSHARNEKGMGAGQSS